MFVMMIVSVSPCIEGEVSIDANKLSNVNIQLNGLKIGEMSHIVKLNKKPDCIKRVNGPADEPEVDPDQKNS
jgi:hypothetical protein